MYRQGDILLIPVDRNTTKYGEQIPPEAERVILALGEATGHAHALSAKLAVLYAIANSTDRLLRTKPGALLVHEEHDNIPLPEGDYIVRRQREYTPEKIKPVTD